MKRSTNQLFRAYALAMTFLLFFTACGYGQFSDTLQITGTITAAIPTKPPCNWPWHWDFSFCRTGYRHNHKAQFSTPCWGYSFNIGGHWFDGTVEPNIWRDGNSVKVSARVNVPRGGGLLFSGARFQVGAALLFEGQAGRELQFSGRSSSNHFQQSFALIHGANTTVYSGKKGKNPFATMKSEDGSEADKMVVSAFSEDDWEIGALTLQDFAGGTYTMQSDPVSFEVYDPQAKETEEYSVQFEINLVAEEGSVPFALESMPSPSPDLALIDIGDCGLSQDDPVTTDELADTDPENTFALTEEFADIDPEDSPAPMEELPDIEPGGASVPAEDFVGIAPEVTPLPAGNQENTGIETTPLPEYAALQPDVSVSDTGYRDLSGSTAKRFDAPYFGYAYTDRAGNRVEKTIVPVCRWDKDTLVVYGNVYVPQAGMPGTPLLMDMCLNMGAAVKFVNGIGTELELKSTHQSGGLEQSFGISRNNVSDSSMLLSLGDSGVVSAWLKNGWKLNTQELDLENMPGMACEREWRLDYQAADMNTGKCKKYGLRLIISVKTEAPVTIPEVTLEPEATPIPTAEATTELALETTPKPADEVTPIPEPTAEPVIEPIFTPDPSVTPASTITPAPEATPAPAEAAAPAPAATPAPAEEAAPAPEVTPAPAATPAPMEAAIPAETPPAPTPDPTAVVTSAPTVVVTPVPLPEMLPDPSSTDSMPVAS